MNIQFFKDHLIDFEIIAAIGVTVLLRYGFDIGWLFATLAGLSAFVLLPLLVLVTFHLRAASMLREGRRIMNSPESIEHLTKESDQRKRK
jgi:hypothetical protein